LVAKLKEHLIDRENDHEDDVQEDKDHKHEEEKMVLNSNAVVNPFTMMVKPLHTSVARITVFGTMALYDFTFSTDIFEAHIFNNLLYY
jgi:hypothetical protein